MRICPGAAESIVIFGVGLEQFVPGGKGWIWHPGKWLYFWKLSRQSPHKYCSLYLSNLFNNQSWIECLYTNSFPNRPLGPGMYMVNKKIFCNSNKIPLILYFLFLEFIPIIWIWHQYFFSINAATNGIQQLCSRSVHGIVRYCSTLYKSF